VGVRGGEGGGGGGEEGVGWADLFVGLEDLVSFGLAGYLGFVDFLHASDVAGEVGFEAGVDGGVVDRDDAGDEVGLAEGEGHGCFGAPFWVDGGLGGS
jgi:hypothetical protein